MNLSEYAARVRRLAQVSALVSTEFAVYATARLRDQFSSKTSATGQAWKPYAASSIRRGRNSLLVESGALRDGTVAQALGDGIVLKGGPKSEYHNDTRQHVPSTMPARWRQYAQSLVAKHMRAVLGG